MTDFFLSQSASLPTVGWELRRKNDEERSVLYLKLTLAAAILGVIVGVIGIVVTVMHVD